MENGVPEATNPKALLLPGTLPIPVHTIISRGDEESSGAEDNLPSTIDMDALKGLNSSDFSFQMSWRSTPRVAHSPNRHTSKTTTPPNGKIILKLSRNNGTAASVAIASTSSEDSEREGEADKFERHPQVPVQQVPVQQVPVQQVPVQQVPVPTAAKERKPRRTKNHTPLRNGVIFPATTTAAGQPTITTTNPNPSSGGGAVKTKGAKKYIPEDNKDVGSSQRGRRPGSLVKKTDDSHGGRSGSRMRSSSRRAKKSKKQSRHSKKALSSKTHTALCQQFNSQCQLASMLRRPEKIRIGSTVVARRSSNPFVLTTTARGSSRGGKPMAEFLKEIGYPSLTALSRSPIAKLSNGHAPSPSSPTRGRRNVAGESPSKRAEPGIFENSNKMQRLPPKKRHIHATSTSTNSSEMDSVEPRKGKTSQNIQMTDADQDEGPQNWPARFGEAAFPPLPLLAAATSVVSTTAPFFTIKPIKAKRGRPSFSSFQDFGEIHKRQRSPHKGKSGKARKIANFVKGSKPLPTATPTTPKEVSEKKVVLVSDPTRKSGRQSIRISQKLVVKTESTTDSVPQATPNNNLTSEETKSKTKRISRKRSLQSSLGKSGEDSTPTAASAPTTTLSPRARSPSKKRVKLSPPSSGVNVVPTDVVIKIENGGEPSPSLARNIPHVAGQLKKTATLRIPTPQSSPTTGTVPGTRKRRKVNRTGFPNSKRRKRLSPIAQTQLVVAAAAVVDSVAETQQANNGREWKSEEREQQLGDEGTRSVKRKTLSAPAELELEPTVQIKIENIPQEGEEGPSFTLSLTERVKIRKRSSTEGMSCQNLDGSTVEALELLGVSPSLLNLPEPPLILPDKTNYLEGGIMSGIYKMSEVKVEGVSGEEEQGVSGEILPYPTYIMNARNKKQNKVKDFDLPYDIWCLGILRAKEKYEDWRAEQELLKAEEKALRKQEARRKSDAGRPKKVQMPEVMPDSWTFKRLRSNTYFGYNKPPVPAEHNEEDQLCECSEGEMKCMGEDCLNRVVFTECSPACGENCCNRRIQKHEWAPDLKRYLTEDKGYGVKTKSLIKRGDFILEYVGEVVSDAEFKERMYTIYANDTHHYCLQLDSGRVIDGHRSGGEGRFVNHSCQPNCEMQKWSVNGLSRMALFALRDIDGGEELSYDYNFSLYNPSEGQPCYCQSENCRGVIGGRTQYKGDSAASKRKSGNTKGNQGSGTIVGGAHAEPSVLEKMKNLSRKDKNYLMTHKCFLVRNYEKIRRMRDDNEDRYGDRLEKLMRSWILRYKAGSSKNKAIILPDDDPKLQSLANVSQILYELYANLIRAKDEGGKCYCEPFMEPPSKKRFPNFYIVYEAGPSTYKLKGLKALEKGILRGDYKTLQALETDIGTVVNTFSEAYEAEKPDIQASVLKIKALYKEGKQKAVIALDPFIVQTGPPGQVSLGNGMPSISSSLPRFTTILEPEVETIRCICGTYSEEGMMIFCERCKVWQHCDCMRESYDPKDAEASMNNAKRLERAKAQSLGRRSPSKSRSPMKAKALPTGGIGDGDEKEKVELDAGVIISVNEELQVLEKGVEEAEPVPLVNGSVGEELDNITPLAEMETQILEVTYEDETAEDEAAKAVEVRKGADYYCERCLPRVVDPEVPMGGTCEIPGRTYYLTLKREDGLLLRKNDTVFVLREWADELRIGTDGKPRPRKTYKTAGKIVKSECDIFRIQDLFKDENGNRFAYGYNYLRPYETYHEPSRKFYPNELLRAPIVEVVSIDLIHGVCWVVDSMTYCRGRPKGCVEEDLYICDFRVDKSARAFSKVGKISQAICTKSYAFDTFETKLKIQRNLHPHGPPSPDFKLKGGGGQSNAEKVRGRKTDDNNKVKVAKYKNTMTSQQMQQMLKKRSEQRERLNRASSALHSKIPEFEADKVDLTHLLEPVGKKKPFWNKKLSF